MNAFSFVKRFQFYVWIGLLWLLLWVFAAFFNSPETFFLQSLNEIWRFFYLVLANLIFFEYSLPFIIKKRSFIFYNIVIGFFLGLIHFLVVSIGLYGWKSLGILLHIYTSFRFVTIDPGGVFNMMIEEVAYQAQGGISSFFFFGLAKLLYNNFQLKQTAQQLRLEKQEAELNYLKSQMNPHFLFNTLNNIYSLAKDKSDLTPKSILQLSKILRFMLYETSGAYIRAEKELEVISDYIALEKLRYNDSLSIKFEYEIEDMDQSLPPLLLIPLVENAFKHGVSETMNHPFVDIHLSINQQQLVLLVKNSTEKLEGDKLVKENIGLSNLRRQLELLYRDYTLTVLQDEAVFIASLHINLKSHV